MTEDDKEQEMVDESNCGQRCIAFFMCLVLYG
jgi:hypothetical protein